MKRLAYLILFLFPVTSFCQEYHFDSFYEFNSSNNINFFMINSSDKNYAFYGYRVEKNIYGYIVDFKSNELHHFDVDNSNNSINLSYTYSENKRKCECDNDNRKLVFNYQNIDIDSSSYKTTITKVKPKNNGKTKWKGQVELNYSKNEQFVFHPNHINFYLHHFFNSDQELKIDSKLPQSIIVYYEQNSSFTTRINKKKKINTSLSISKEQLNYRK